jgi:putative Mn2+ efflux pump MntP
VSRPGGRASLPGTGGGPPWIALSNVGPVLALLLVAVSLGLSNFAAAVTIGVVSVTMSLLGLELGDRLGTRTGERGELLGGLVLIAVGVAVASGIL